MQNQNLASIIIPCYNQGRFLGEAIASAFRQTYLHYEIIVVDDGSTDETRQIASNFAGVRCLSQKNRGLAAARNAGLGASRGSYVIFLDADDRLLPNALADGITALHAHPECAFAYGHVKLIAGDGSSLASPQQVAVERDHYLELLRHNYIWTPGAVVYRRAIFDCTAGFNRRVSGSADFDLNARIARRFPLCCSGSVVLEYRRHQAGMSRDFAHMLKDAVAARRLQRKFVKGDKQLEAALKDGIRGVQEDYGENLIHRLLDRLRKRRWRGIIAGLLALLRYYPQGVARLTFRKLHRRAVKVQN